MPPLNNPQNKTFLPFSKGMTLIEIIVVIALAGLLLSLGTVVLTDWFDDQLSKITSELAGTIKYTYNESALKNKIYRLKIDLNQRTISVEASAEDIKIDNSLEEKSLQSDETQKELSATEDLENNPPKKESFSQSSSYLLKPIQLPNGIKIKDVYVAHAGKKIENGITAIYFFPNGWVEKSIINLCDDKEERFYSIEVESLTGKAIIRREYFNYEQNR